MRLEALKDVLQVALSASLEAGAAIMEIYSTKDFGVEYKEDDSPLTKADLAAHHVIVKHLETTGIPVLSEEGKDIPYEERKTWSRLWIVDPIDGTKEFIKRNGEFTVNIALIEDQNVIAGVVYAPAIDTLYISANTLGAYRCIGKTMSNDLEDVLKNATKLPIERTDKTYTVVASRSHLTKETEDFITELESLYDEVKTISKGSSLKLCMVAEGTANCYPRFAPTMEWDTAAGQAICNHSGVEVLDYETKSRMLYNRQELRNNWFLVK